jgi:putative two-component system response regulator
MTDTNAARKLILVVDDTADNLTLMTELLRDQYRVKIANNGERALQIAASEPKPDMILLDIMMPGVDGYEVCRQLKANAATHDIPVIFLTAKTQVEDEKLGLDLGALDYVTKPVSPPVLLARVRNHLQLKEMRDLLRDHNQFLEAEVARRTRDLRAIQDTTIMALASLAETRDNETGNHLRRTQNYVKALAERLRLLPQFASQLDDATIELLYKSAPLHDIGKVGVPDAILLKPGKLTLEEFEIMKTHPALGHEAILNAERWLEDKADSFLRFAREIAYTHHEKWDGSGYPRGLAGEAIPLSGRLMALADVYDALISRRVYKEPFSHEYAVDYILAQRGRHFDPVMVDCFREIADSFNEIALRFADEEPG